MEPILGIDLGTTNSEVAIIQDGRPVVLPDSDGAAILPSVVGLDREGRLLVGRAARNQAILAPERTVKSIKRKMGLDVKVTLGEQSFTPQEISAMILRTLKERAEQFVGQPLRKSVITVPAFFNDNQRQATREAGELAGLEVVRIINEPTAASLVYEAHATRRERLLVYDLGGGTFDVSIVQIERGVVEVLASHGDTHLGGDDFDQLLLGFVCNRFEDEHGIDLRTIPVANSRLLQAVEEAKKRLSSEAFTQLSEEFLVEKDGLPLHLQQELDRRDYEELIGPLLNKTVRCVDAALVDAKLHAQDIDKIILVGGSSRTPLIHHLLHEQLGQTPHREVDPDLCVAMGAAVQGGLIAGVDVGPVLVDITPHTMGIQCLGDLHGSLSEFTFSPVIPRNTPLPATRSEIYHTTYDGQKSVEIHVLQGEEPDARHNQSIGKFTLEGLDPKAPEGSEILVRFALNLDGILVVTAVERATSLEKQLKIDNAITRFQTSDRQEAISKLEAMFPDAEVEETSGLLGGLAATTPEPSAMAEDVRQLIAKSRRLAQGAPERDATEIADLVRQLEQAIAEQDAGAVQEVQEQLEDVLFYLEDA